MPFYCLIHGNVFTLNLLREPYIGWNDSKTFHKNIHATNKTTITMCIESFGFSHTKQLQTKQRNKHIMLNFGASLSQAQWKYWLCSLMNNWASTLSLTQVGTSNTIIHHVMCQGFLHKHSHFELLQTSLEGRTTIKDIKHFLEYIWDY